MTRLELLRRFEGRFREAGLPSQEARWLLAHALGLKDDELLHKLHENVPAEIAEQMEAWLQRRRQGYPLQLILGYSLFYVPGLEGGEGLRLEVRPGVLIPRPETEGLVELTFGLLPRDRSFSGRLLDVGTGSGAIALALKRQFPQAEVWATDTDPAAVELARKNAQRSGLEVKVLFAPYTAHLQALDLVVSNPPYLPEVYREQAPPELAYESPQALYSGPEGLDMPRELLCHAWRALKPGGGLALELAESNVHTLAEEARRAGWEAVQVHHDLAGQPRYLSARRPHSRGYGMLG
ncbi:MULTISPECIES: peptide chain release factor N(5)-glutamine methyltransferase [unclassified Meiothermus]|uniref:peptide chain release factor N(5)-glutamine methyltransferase n=1 Tax=unclassified Meiothermus TaxID=370471 RepID=UPI000D7CC845|nr:MULTISPECIES: peptide chain release factor N(5)-glutamine methyltransferase [unclassified Meiothermus]PZA07371.1 peptide chain release factor N(5)-glutamine methyltransferase [Meiothermus sp. Pnk-1]RYM37365.1 peptide chain release factor N(5)-glutamine methyltransferase [Meiothermus sp. PNK-Is4]